MDTTTSIILSALTSSPVEDINVTVTNSTLLTTSVSGQASEGFFGWGFLLSMLSVLVVVVLVVCNMPGAISCLVKKCRRTDPEDDDYDDEEEEEEEEEGNVEKEVAGHLNNDSSSTNNQAESTVILIDDIKNDDDDENNSMVISRSNNNNNNSGSSIKKLTGGVPKLLSRVWNCVTVLRGGLQERRELLPFVSSLLFNPGGRGSSGGGQWLAVQPADCGCGPLCRGGDGHCPVYRPLTVPLMIQQQAV